MQIISKVPLITVFGYIIIAIAMYSLVQFLDDDYYSQCRSSKIRCNRKGVTCAPYGHTHFPARILAQHDSLNLIKSLINSLQHGLPIVIVENQDLSNKSTNSDPEYFPDVSIGLNSNLSLPIESNSSAGHISFSLPSDMEKKRTFPTTKLVPTIEEGTKKNYCLFCHKLVTKIVRHMGTVHRNEDDVKRFLSLPKQSKERKKIITEIKNNANFQYNTEKRLYGGQLVVSRRPLKKENRTEEHYIPCANCKAFFSKLNLRNHFKTCTRGKLQGRRQSLSLGRRVRSSLHEKACDLLRDKVFPIIREDSTILDVRNDELLIIYANDLCTKFASRPHCYSLIRNKIRKVALFLSHMKSIDDSIEMLSDVFHPRHYDKIIEVINIMGKYNKETGQLGAPSTAFDMGTQLKILCETLKCEYIKKSDEKRLKEVENIALLMKQGLTTSVNVNVKETQIEKKRKKQVVLPSRKDIAKLMVYLYTNQKKYYNRIKNKPFERHNWIHLVQYTMLCIQTFNRRRPGETERILIEDFKRRETISENTNPEMYNALSEQEKKMTKRYCIFQVRGKLVKNVSILLNNEIECSLQLILRYRNKAGVPKENPYVFGQPYSARAAFEHRFYRICPLLNKAAVACGADNPHTLRTVQLRKHIATEAALLHTKYGFETNDLANFMGHDEHIHKDHYRMPQVAKQITGIGRLLEYVQGLDGQKKGKTSSGIIENNETFNDMDSDSSEYSDKSDIQPSKKRSRRSEDLGKQFIIRRSWTPSEIKEALRHFRDHIEARRDPSVREIRHAIEVSGELQNRSESQIRLWVRNQYEKIRKSKDTDSD